MTTTWEEAAMADVKAIYVSAPEIDNNLVVGYESGNWDGLASSAWLTAQRALQCSITPNQIVDLLASKQHDYGNQNILKFGAQGIKVRLWDKIARVNNLLSRPGTEKNESLVDSYMDIIGYVVLLRMFEAGTFTLPLEADIPTVDAEASDIDPVLYRSYKVTFAGGATTTITFLERA